MLTDRYNTATSRQGTATPFSDGSGCFAKQGMRKGRTWLNSEKQELTLKEKGLGGVAWPDKTFLQLTSWLTETGLTLSLHTRHLSLAWCVRQ